LEVSIETQEPSRALQEPSPLARWAGSLKGL